MKTSTKTITKWKQDRVFESQQEGNPSHIVIDGGRQLGPGPKSLLLSGLAGCSAIDVLDILEKMRIKFSDFTIEVEAEQTTDHPKVFKDILITYSIRTDKSNEDKVIKAIDLSLEKYCGVSAMLRKNSAIDYKLQLIP
ncbi:MAG: OsmC family protein [Chitinophagaceae bacterium]|nr:OsmC family protein [Chitinophagaceae bacterium]